MFKINKKLEYALISLKHMSEKYPGELTSAKEISETYKASFDVTARVLQILTQHEILKSEHGAHGGYQIQKDLSKVSFYELAEILIGKVQLTRCLHDDPHCDLLSTCNIVTPIVKLNDRLKEFYETISIHDLLLSHHKKQKQEQLTKHFTV